MRRFKRESGTTSLLHVQKFSHGPDYRSYFFIGGGAEATSRTTPYFFKWNHVFFFMTLLPILRRIQRPKTQGHSSHAKYENSQKIETYRNSHFQRTH